MFLFKKIVAAFLYPVPLCLEILCVGLVFLWFTSKQRAGKILVTMGTVLLALLSLPGAPETLLRPLERQYPALMDLDTLKSPDPEGKTAVKWIVVLGGGSSTDPSIPVTSNPSPETLFRLLEGFRFSREIPGSRLLLSGGAVCQTQSVALAMARVAEVMGVNPQRVVLEPDSRDTAEQAGFIKDLVGNDKFILVTSASHMPRSMALFRKRGLDPIPAPAGHLVRGSFNLHPMALFPTGEALGRSEAAFHEYLGIAWSWLRGEV